MVVIRGDPRKSHRPVEGLRVALGLSTGPNPVSVILLDEARFLLTMDCDAREDIIDGEILETHLPAVKELALPFVVPEGTRASFEFDPELTVRTVSRNHIASLLTQADRILVF